MGCFESKDKKATPHQKASPPQQQHHQHRSRGPQLIRCAPHDPTFGSDQTSSVVSRTGCANLAAIALFLCVDPDSEMPHVIPPIADMVYHLAWTQTSVALSGKRYSGHFVFPQLAEQVKGGVVPRDQEFPFPPEDPAFHKVKGLMRCQCMTQLRSGAVVGGLRDEQQLISFHGQKHIFTVNCLFAPVSLVQRRMSDNLLILTKDSALEQVVSTTGGKSDVSRTVVKVPASASSSFIHVTVTANDVIVLLTSNLEVIVMNSNDRDVQFTVSPGAPRLSLDGSIAMVSHTHAAILSKQYFFLIDTSVGKLVASWKHGWKKLGLVTCSATVGKGLVAFGTSSSEVYLLDFSPCFNKDNNGDKKNITTMPRIVGFRGNMSARSLCAWA